MTIAWRSSLIPSHRYSGERVRERGAVCVKNQDRYLFFDHTVPLSPALSPRGEGVARWEER